MNKDKKQVFQKKIKEKQRRKELGRLGRIIEDGQYITSLAKEMLERLVPDADISVIADYFDDKLQNSNYAFYPVSIEIERFACNFCPMEGMKLNEDSVISFTFQMIYNKFDPKESRVPLKCAYSKSMKNNGYKKMISQINKACLFGIKECLAGKFLTHPRRSIVKILEDFSLTGEKNIHGIYSVVDLYGFNLENPEKILPCTKKLFDAERKGANGKILENELYYVDVYGTDLCKDVCSKKFAQYPTMMVLPIESDIVMRNRRLKELKNTQYYKKLYNYLLDKYGQGNVFSLRKFKRDYKEHFNRESKMDDLAALHGVELLHGYPALEIVNDFENKKQEGMRLSKERKKLEKEKEELSNSGDNKNNKNLSKMNDIDCRISEINIKIKKLNNNDNVVCHHGHVVYVIDDKTNIIIC